MIRTTAALLGWTLLLLVLAPPSETAADETRKSRNTCYSISVRASEAIKNPKRRTRSRPSFSAAEILDLVLRVQFAANLKGAHQVELRLFTPKGHLYQTFSIPVSTGAETADAQGRRQSHQAWASATLPVAGTTIVNSSLYGVWKAEAYLDGEQVPCGRAQEFEIVP